MSRGMYVFFIQKETGASRSNSNSMPWSAGMKRRFIRPRSRLSSSAATSTLKPCVPRR